MLANALGLDSGKLAASLKLSPATVSRRRRELRPLPVESSALLLGISRMVVDLQTMVEKFVGHSGSDAGAWLGRWLTRPLPALGWQQPSDWLGTVEDQQVASDMLGRIVYGVYC
jgi:putative toxin-antitoxin system antitoxin component (TIGR02293 family)